ncbi:MAG TPA: isocitrate/isopropylmalate family dehydrogenase, partial [Urbifossiella sp.]
MRKIVFVQGGGVGLDREAAVRKLLAAAGVAIEFEVHPAGRAAIEQGRAALPPELFESIRTAGIALKTKLLPAKITAHAKAKNAKAPANFNVDFRRELGLFASVRPVHNLAGLASRFTGVNYLLVREITEDLYTASEHELVPGVVQSFKVVTEAACLRFFRFAFDLARQQGRKSVHCIHKANILKLADGLYLDCFRR